MKCWNFCSWSSRLIFSVLSMWKKHLQPSVELQTVTRGAKIGVCFPYIVIKILFVFFSLWYCVRLHDAAEYTQKIKSFYFAVGGYIHNHNTILSCRKTYINSENKFILSIAATMFGCYLSRYRRRGLRVTIY